MFVCLQWATQSVCHCLGLRWWQPKGPWWPTRPPLPSPEWNKKRRERIEAKKLNVPIRPPLKVWRMWRMRRQWRIFQSSFFLLWPPCSPVYSTLMRKTAVNHSFERAWLYAPPPQWPVGDMGRIAGLECGPSMWWSWWFSRSCLRPTVEDGGIAPCGCRESVG